MRQLDGHIAGVVGPRSGGSGPVGRIIRNGRQLHPAATRGGFIRGVEGRIETRSQRGSEMSGRRSSAPHTALDSVVAPFALTGAVDVASSSLASRAARAAAAGRAG